MSLETESCIADRLEASANALEDAADMLGDHAEMLEKMRVRVQAVALSLRSDVEDLRSPEAQHDNAERSRSRSRNPSSPSLPAPPKRRSKLSAPRPSLPLPRSVRDSQQASESRRAAAAAESRRAELPSLGRPQAAAAAESRPRPGETWDCANAEREHVPDCEFVATLSCERTSNNKPKYPYLCISCYEWYAKEAGCSLDLTKTKSLYPGEVEVPQL